MVKKKMMLVLTKMNTFRTDHGSDDEEEDVEEAEVANALSGSFEEGIPFPQRQESSPSSSPPPRGSPIERFVGKVANLMGWSSDSEGGNVPRENLEESSKIGVEVEVVVGTGRSLIACSIDRSTT